MRMKWARQGCHVARQNAVTRTVVEAWDLGRVLDQCLVHDNKALWGVLVVLVERG